MARILLPLSVAGLVSGVNMNGEYTIKPTPRGGDPSKFPTDYEDYPGGAEYFDVYSPAINSTYAEVIWKTFDPISLPPDIVKRFRDKPMAIIGMEWDQVRKTSQGDVSVPMNMAYNHHYGANVLGAQAEMIRVPVSDPRVAKQTKGMHPPPVHKGHVQIVHDKGPGSAVPNAQNFGTQNGGEARKSFHGFAPGIGRSVMSPETFSLSIMQIDTWNRDKMDISGSSPFVAGPLPKHSLAGKEAHYSGLLECPLTTRVTKIPPKLYEVRLNHTCDKPIDQESRCLSAAKALVPPGTKVDINMLSTSKLPVGCVVSMDKEGHASAYFNTDLASKAACGQGVTSVAGSNSDLTNLRVELDQASTNATITISGPAGNWFGVGFGAQTMEYTNWAIIVDGNGGVSERKLQEQSPGDLLKPSVHVVSTSVEDGLRSVVLTAPREGPYFSFALDDAELYYINAIGSSPTLSYHKSEAAATLYMLATTPEGASCLCTIPNPKGGQVRYDPTGAKVDFQEMCHPGQMIEEHNPTCKLEDYTGGIQTCLDGFRLLDAEQEVPWLDQPLVYYQKFRFWFQEYNDHKEVYHYSYKMGAVTGEYDVPQCAAGTPTEQCTYTFEDTFTVPPDNLYLAGVRSHCHSGTCLSLRVYDNATGELICDQPSIFGKGVEKRFDEPGYINRPPCLWGNGYGLEKPPLVANRTFRAVAITNSTYGHHGEMAIPVFFTVNDQNFTWKK